MRFPKLVCCLLCVSKVHLPISFPSAVLQEEPPVLQVCPIVLVFDRLVALYILLGILSLVISAIWELPTCVLAYKLTPRRWLLLPHHEVWTRETDATCSVKTALCPLSSLTLSSRSTTLPLSLWRCVAGSDCFKWQRSMRDAKRAGLRSCHAC